MLQYLNTIEPRTWIPSGKTIILAAAACIAFWTCLMQKKSNEIKLTSQSIEECSKILLKLYTDKVILEMKKELLSSYKKALEYPKEPKTLFINESLYAVN